MQPPDQIQYARRFIIRAPDQPDLHGVEFPSGRIIFDLPDQGLGGATDITHVRELHAGTVHFADEETS
ncbi:hypothetical protein ABTX35_18965 [Streptomyces sp. NPDC096080]|uniref:hypothetical protein n=1 Tax=Streptomyces sp. NPDC096080 TaxID=3156693 RepID=UPI00332EA706